MVALFLTTTISCQNVFALLNRIDKSTSVSKQQKIEIINVIRDYVPSCPVIIKKNETKNR